MTYIPPWNFCHECKKAVLYKYFPRVLPYDFRCLKYANVVPLHKKNEKNLKGNYSLISHSLIKGKILQKLIYDSLYSYLLSHEPLNPNHSGFCPGDSTVIQLLSITHNIFKAFDCNPPVDVRTVYLDISTALERVWHDGLIHRLKRCNISGKILFLIQSFLKNRKQGTVMNEQGPDRWLHYRWCWGSFD